ncbi:hypothetical protein EYF80_036242 [Liparis tanakae]|uniref:Uncharacterized protein n=1 Tax=Liparis tanakae TaxID=230148 RepID=A0A4Z2GLM4_9TELE|nr:hypothetical protein EYF80_036242 [Liparis tanakae]
MLMPSCCIGTFFFFCGYTRNLYDKHEPNGTTPHWGMRQAGFKYTAKVIGHRVVVVIQLKH